MNTRREFIPFSPPLIEDDDIAQVTQCLRSGWITTGPRVEEFQKMVATAAGTAHAVATSSCTMAMQVALMVMGVGPGHDVITTPFTFASTAHVICYVGAEPVFADVEEDTGNLDPVRVREVIERDYERRDGSMMNRLTGRRLKAIMPVHYGGHCCDMDLLMDLAETYDLLVIEDAAHAIGATYRGRPAGSLGHAGCFSFYATKNVATAEGGMLVTDNEQWAEAARRMTMYGISDARKIWGRYAPKGTWSYDVAELGLKCNLPDILAALGVSQMRKFERMQARRSENASIYYELFSRCSGRIRVPVVKDYAGHAWHLYPMRLCAEGLPAFRDRFVEQLREHGIGASVLFIPLHYHSYYQRRLGKDVGGMFPVAERIFKGIVNLPISPSITPDEVRYIAETVVSLAERANG